MNRGLSQRNDWLEISRRGSSASRVGTNFERNATYVPPHWRGACFAQARVLDGEHWIHSLNRERLPPMRRYLIRGRKRAPNGVTPSNLDPSAGQATARPHR